MILSKKKKAEQVIIWEEKNNKPYFYSPCQITQCIGGINIGNNTTPKYQKCLTSCPLCFNCGDLNKSRIFHDHGRTKDGRKITLFMGGYDEYGSSCASDVATKIEKCLLKTILSKASNSNDKLINS